MKDHSIPQLFERCAVGDASAWEAMLIEFGPWLRVTLRRALSAAGGPVCDEEDVAELLQETWFRLLVGGGRLLRSFRGGSRGEAAAYLASVARSVAADRSRQRRARKRHAVLVGLEGLEPRDLAPGPEARLLARERRGALRRRLDDILGARASKRSRRSVELALVHGLTSREIASRSRGGTSVGAVNSLVHRVRRRLVEQGICPPRR